MLTYKPPTREDWDKAKEYLPFACGDLVITEGEQYPSKIINIECRGNMGRNGYFIFHVQSTEPLPSHIEPDSEEADEWICAGQYGFTSHDAHAYRKMNSVQ